MPIVYSPTNPDPVMTQSAWEDGRSHAQVTKYGWIFTALVVWLMGAVPLLCARWRRKFGDMRPGASVLAIKWEAHRRSDSTERSTPESRRADGHWCVTFGDNTHAPYVDSPAVRDELRVRVPSVSLDGLQDLAKTPAQRISEVVWAAPTVPPAAGFPDPSGSGALRWWNGAAWTEHTRPVG